MNKNLVMDCIKLCVITLIAGLLLGIVYNVTKAPIAAQEEKTKQEAYKAVFTNAARFEEIKLNQKEVSAVLKKNDLGQNTISEAVKAVDNSGKELGFVFSVTNPDGYGGNITLSVGIRDDGTVNGYETLSISETAGLGMKAKEDKFKSNFKNKKADKFEVVKDGSGKNDDSKVDAISGATITSRAVTSAVNSCVAYSKSLKGGN
ncbi:RnfABCDGE type electron transport complex subunit G [Anaerostipes sp.]|uniref:RnfABCDGE type electron transport complex subunit G n=1 Tax=Anaerostipes sp. TaxID=1872530 RepID=UPI003FED83B2